MALTPEARYNLANSKALSRRAMTETEQCSVPGCEQIAAASLHARPLCRKHFISTCRAELEAYDLRLKENRLGDVSPESAWRFVQECMRQADHIDQTAEDLDEFERDRLLDLLLGAAELGRHLRRSPRRVASIPIRVCSEKSDRPWEEETQTRVISRYGALVKCQHAVEADERIRVVRADNGRQAHARVAWHQRKGEGPPDVGIEFLDCDNFWELDWESSGTGV